MKNRKKYFFLAATAVVVVLAAGAGGVYLHGRLMAAKTADTLVSDQLPLYAPGDKPVKINLKTLDAQTGKWSDWPVTIYQSKSPLNQVKQAVLQFVDHSTSLGIPPGLAVNEVYLTQEGNVVVDISTGGLSPGTMGFFDELLFIRGLIETLSKNFPQVRAVKLLVDGQDAPTLAGHYALGTSESALAAKTPTN
jgi:hypothetical protein